jgi:hypothetical protein
MKITELEWVMHNWDALTDHERARLESYDLRKQYASGELTYSLTVLHLVMGLCIEIYNAHDGGKELPIKLVELLDDMVLTRRGAVRMFGVRAKFSDGSTRRWDLTTDQLARLGARHITRLSETRKLKDWVMGDGRGFFEGQVNRR